MVYLKRTKRWFQRVIKNSMKKQKSPERVPRRSSHFPLETIRFKLQVVDIGMLSHPIEVASEGLVRNPIDCCQDGEHSKADSCLYKLIFVPKMIRIAWGWSSSQTMHSVAQFTHWGQPRKWNFCWEPRCSKLPCAKKCASCATVPASKTVSFAAKVVCDTAWVAKCRSASSSAGVWPQRCK